MMMLSWLANVVSLHRRETAVLPSRPDALRHSAAARSFLSFMRANPYMFALILAIALLIANIAVLPAFGAPSSYAPTLGGLAPFALVAMASAPAILAGGIDVSIGPLVGLLGIVYVVYLQPHGLGAPGASIPIILCIGGAMGLLNGFLIAILRYQPVIATLCMYFILGGVGEAILPTARQALPSWTDNLGGSIGGIPGGLITILVPLVAWFLLSWRTSFVKTLLAVGGRDTAALTAGINVTRLRLLAYCLGGLIAGIAALALTGLTRDADPTIGAQYTLVALAGASIGGTVIGGGRGGLIGTVFGAACIFLIENLLSNTGFSPFWLQVVYGAVLVLTMILSRHRAASASAGDMR
jgi:ribose transport system permease protein